MHAEALREVSYCTAQSDMTHYCMFVRTWKSEHHPLPGLDSFTYASNLTSPWFINSTRPLQDKCSFLYSEVGIDTHFVFLLRDGVCKSGTDCKSQPGFVRINAVHKRIAYGSKLNCDEMALIYSIYQVELISCLVPWNQLCNKLRPPCSARGLKRILKL